jgi:hypothetical protein
MRKKVAAVFFFYFQLKIAAPNIRQTANCQVKLFIQTKLKNSKNSKNSKNAPY